MYSLCALGFQTALRSALIRNDTTRGLEVSIYIPNTSQEEKIKSERRAWNYTAIRFIARQPFP